MEQKNYGRRWIILFAVPIVAFLTTSCGTVHRTKVGYKKYLISTLEIGTTIDSVINKLGAPDSRQTNLVDHKTVEVMFYKTTSHAAEIGIEYSPKYTPLFFQEGTLFSIGKEISTPSLTVQQVEEILRKK